MFGFAPKEKAYFAPFAVFLGFLFLRDAVEKVFDGVASPWWQSDPVLWIFPLQTVVCGWMVLQWWRHYEWRRPRVADIALATGVGVLVLAIWGIVGGFVAIRRFRWDPRPE